MFHNLFSIIMLMAQALFTLGAGVKYSDETSDIVAWSEAVKSGVFKQMIKIDYSKKIWDNKARYMPAQSILNKFKKRQASSTITFGWDRKVMKDIVYTGASFTSQAAVAELNLELAEGDINHVLQEQNLMLGFTPTDTENYTNDVFISSKTVSGNVAAVKVKPVDPTKKIGIASGVTVPTGTVVNVLGTIFNQYSGSVSPIAFFPTKVTNYQQYFKFPYEYDETAAKEDLYVDGTLKNMLDKDAQFAILLQREKALLFNGKKYKKDAIVSDKTQRAKMQGLIYSILYGDDLGNVSPAVVGYNTAFTMDKFEEFQFNLFDPELGDPYMKRLVFGNKAARKKFTDMKNSMQSVREITPNKSYGALPVDTIYTDAGVIDLVVHPRIAARYPEMDKPFMLALTPPMVEMVEMTPTYLAANIQNPDVTGFKSEYRSQFTAIYNNIGTPYFGLLYDADKSVL